MRVTFLGTGSAMPTGERYQTGVLLEDDGRRLLVDCGSGVLHRLQQSGVGYEAVSSVLLTHHHLDHVSDLMALLKARWLAGEEHLEVVGPAGTKDLLDGLLDVHDYLQDRMDLRVREVGEHAFEVAGFEVEAFETRHSMPCLAYRFGEVSESNSEARGTSSRGGFVFGADSEAFEGLANFADGCEVLAHDCSFPDEVDVDNHPTPTQLGRALADSGADIGRVFLTHLYPHTEGRHEEMLDSIGTVYDGDVRFAEDLRTVEL
ncbi:MBL fold metallo-hydrolase [Halorussus salilacus]|uniref:MBL fold metallo-hydrolase n=1 Tax=Halorussus salilacus TaxID=2953750 RepID=UPI00209E9D29|nr:MBL fold metallo-hydrolase [Halorussus salilacus]USZ67840.1 MBL fold metallo-hydrolase [Halorussus salilacus]